MSYGVLLSSRAERDLRRLPRDASRRVAAALAALAGTPRPPDSRKLTASEEWRIRVGAYRIRYRVSDPSREVTVTRIAHRREVYRP